MRFFIYPIDIQHIHFHDNILGSYSRNHDLHLYKLRSRRKDCARHMGVDKYFVYKLQWVNSHR